MTSICIADVAVGPKCGMQRSTFYIVEAAKMHGFVFSDAGVYGILDPVMRNCYVDRADIGTEIDIHSPSV